MTIADDKRQGGSQTPDMTGGTSVTGSEPATPALGASTSTSMADPTASGLGVNDSMTAGSGPDASMAAPGIGGMAASSGSTAATGTGAISGGTGALGLGTTGGMASTGGSTSGMGGDQSGKLGQVKQQASEQASKLKGQATEKLRNAAVDGKTRAADKIDGFAQAAHETAQKIEEQAGPQVGRYAHQAADALDSLSQTLRNKDVDELFNDAQALMRRSPAIAIGAAAAVGFALARFLKASSERMEPDYSYRRSGSMSEPTASAIDTGYGTTTTRTNGNGNGTSAYNA